MLAIRYSANSDKEKNHSLQFDSLNTFVHLSIQGKIDETRTKLLAVQRDEDGGVRLLTDRSNKHDAIAACFWRCCRCWYYYYYCYWCPYLQATASCRGSSDLVVCRFSSLITVSPARLSKSRAKRLGSSRFASRRTGRWMDERVSRPDEWSKASDLLG